MSYPLSINISLPGGQYRAEHLRQHSGSLRGVEKCNATWRNVDVMFDCIQLLTRNSKSRCAERKLVIAAQLLNTTYRR